jgi:hypothetical protein
VHKDIQINVALVLDKGGKIVEIHRRLQLLVKYSTILRAQKQEKLGRYL